MQQKELWKEKKKKKSKTLPINKAPTYLGAVNDYSLVLWALKTGEPVREGWVDKRKCWGLLNEKEKERIKEIYA